MATTANTAAYRRCNTSWMHNAGYYYPRASDTENIFMCAIRALSSVTDMDTQLKNYPLKLRTDRCDKYVSLDDANRYIRALFNVHKRYHYNRGNRIRSNCYTMPDDSPYAMACVVGQGYVFIDTIDHDIYYSHSYGDIIEIWTITDMKRQLQTIQPAALQGILNGVYNSAAKIT